MKTLIYDNAFHIVNGASKYILSVAEMLKQHGEVYLVGDKPFSSDFMKHFYDVTIAPQYLLHADFNDSMVLLRTYGHMKKCALISRMSDGYDLFINNNGGFFYQIRPQANKSVVVFHFLMDPRSVTRPSGKGRDMNSFFRRILLPDPQKYNFVRRYDGAVCNSDFTKEWVIRWQGRTDVKEINPPVHLPSGNFLKKENLIINIGRFGPPGTGGDIKKRDAIIEVFVTLCKRGIKDYRLILAGGSIPHSETDQYLRRLRKMAEGYPVEFYLDLDHSSLKGLYSRAKIFWHLMGLGADEMREPDKFEPFGMVTVEAMSYGVVPIVANAGGQREIVQNQVNGFLINTREELVERTGYLCRDDKQWVRLTHEARKRSAAFALPVFRKKWRALLLDIGIDS